MAAGRFRVGPWCNEVSVEPLIFKGFVTSWVKGRTVKRRWGMLFLVPTPHGGGLSFRMGLRPTGDPRLAVSCGMVLSD